MLGFGRAPIFANKAGILLPTASASIVPPVTLIPDLAVISPTESTFTTSSYVNEPPIETLPLKTASPVNVDSPPTLKFL